MDSAQANLKKLNKIIWIPITIMLTAGIIIRNVSVTFNGPKFSLDQIENPNMLKIIPIIVNKNPMTIPFSKLINLKKTKWI